MLRDRWGQPFEGTRAELRKWNDKEAKRRRRAEKKRVELYLTPGTGLALDRVMTRADIQLEELFQLFVLQLDAPSTDAEFAELCRFPRIRPLDLEKFYAQLGADPDQAGNEEENDDSND